MVVLSRCDAIAITAAAIQEIVIAGIWFAIWFVTPTVSTPDSVVASSTTEPIPGTVAEEEVIATATIEAIVAATTPRVVATSATKENVIAATTWNRVKYHTYYTCTWKGTVTCIRIIP